MNLDKVTLPKDFRGAAKIAITTINEFSIDDQMNKIKDHRISNMVMDLREKIKLISDDIQERATKDHIAYKSTVNFAAIFTQKKQFWFDVKLPKEDVKNKFPKLDVRPHKDPIFTHIRCKEQTKLEDLVTLAEEAYENTR